MRGFLAKLCRKNGIMKRIFSMVLSVVLMSSAVQALPAGTLVANATGTEQNIKVHVKVPDVWNWGTPYLWYGGGSATITSDGSTAVTPVTNFSWGSDKAYVMTEDIALRGGDYKIYYIYAKGDFSNLQFLDLSEDKTTVENFINNAYSAYMAEHTEETATSLYFNCSDKKWYTDSACTQLLTSAAPETNITVNLGIPTAWGWASPAMQYWGCGTVTLSGCGAAETISGWGGAQGYPLTSAGTENGINWYTINLKGTLTGIGTQFLDLNTPASNTGGSVFVNDLLADTYKQASATNVYLSYVDGAWTWYKDKAMTDPVVAPPAITEQTITVHFNNSESWTKVAAYMGKTGSFNPLTYQGNTVYGYAKEWPGAEVETDPDNAGYYSFKITTDPAELGLIMTNGASSGAIQTENITYTPDTATTELWISLTSSTGNRTFSISETAPSGWVNNTRTINPPVDPYAGLAYSSPEVSAERKVTFNLAAADRTSAEVMGGLSSWTIGQGFTMTLDGDHFTYTTEAPVAPGIYEYKYVVNGGSWITDPLCTLSKNGNSAVVVPGLSNGEVAPEKGVVTDLPATLKFYTAGSLTPENKAVTYTLDDAALASLVTIDNINHKITVDAACSETEFTLTATSDAGTSKIYVKPQDKIFNYTIYYYDFTAAHMAADAADLWVWSSDGATVTTPASFTTQALSDGRTWLKTVVSTPSKDIGFKARSFGCWDWETGNYGYENTAEAENVTLYIVNGDATVYTSLPTLVEPRERYIIVSYDRPNGDYDDATAGTGWNFYSWNTGFGSGTEIYTEELNGEHVMVAPIRDSQVDFTLAFILRNSEKAAAGNKWITKDGGDNYVTIPGDQSVVKIYYKQGSGVVKTLSYNKSYEIDGTTDTITFYYRDDETLVATNSARLAVPVKVVIDGTEYDMTYDAANERYYYALTGCTSRTYNFSYKVGAEAVADKFASNGSVTYKSFNDLSISASLSQSSMNYNDNSVLSVSFTGADAGLITQAEVQSITADLSQLGLSSKFAIAPELMEGTISVDRSVATGQKTIPVTVKDVYGHIYRTSVTVNVTARDADSFDWDEAVIYMTCTDRFFDGNTSNNTTVPGKGKDSTLGYHGGDFAGLTAKLDYLQKLGVNTIWITPIVQNADTATDTGYHGYWASDFTQLSSYLGTEAEFSALLSAAHDRGMKIMVDVVLNHAGYDTEDDFNNVLAAKDMIRDASNTIVGDDIYSSLSGLPDFVTEDEDVRNQLIEWQVAWMRNYDIDYYRVDTVKHVDNLTWQAFKNELTKVNPNFKMIGEYYGAGYASTGGALGTGTMDSLLDFDINDKAIDFVTGSITSVENFYANRNKSLSNSATLGGFLSSHDEDSFVDKLINEKSKTEAQALALAKVAAALQITAKGQVVIYYGEEIGQHGLNNYPVQSNRNDFDWDAAQAQQGDADSMLTHYQKLLCIRKTFSDVFSIGTRTKIATNDSAGYDVFKRAYDGTEIFVGLNIKDAAQTVSFATGTDNGTVYQDMYSGIYYMVANGTLSVDIPSASNGGTVILVKTADAAPSLPKTPTTPAEDTQTVTPPANTTVEDNTTDDNTGNTEDNDAEGVQTEVETGADTTVPETVKEITPIVDEKLQNAVKKEVEQILDDVVNGEVKKGAVTVETLKNIKDAYADGESILTEIVVETVDEATINQDVKDALQKALADSVKDKKVSEVKIAQYLDLSVLLKTASGKELGKINKLSKEVTFTIAIPQELKKEGRAFVVLRMHEGETTVLETKMNEDGTLSFTTDRFSTYALAYIDALAEDVTDDVTSPDTDATGTTDSKDEGGNFTTFIVVGLIIVILAALFIIFFVLKDKKKVK